MRPVLPSRTRWEQVDALFQAALDTPAQDRHALINRAAGGDADLAREVRFLLDREREAESVIGESVSGYAAPLLAAIGAGDDTEAGTSLVGARLGPYRLVEEVGHGGMGTVYRAERADAEFEQQVALKLVKRGMDTDEVLGRFRAERQILARLAHPNIARLLDGGMSGDGRPYLVMEYIDGLPITAHCDQRALGVTARLALFQTACRAVQYAHQNLVVHRDIKPSNVLVTPAGDVKLLDFGIAKVLQGEDEDAAPRTRTAVPLLTPEYASPEQARNEPVTTASDVYALGILLHELLAGRRPVADARAPDRRIVDPRLAGDLGRITGKALAPEVARRYQSPAELVDEIDRHLRGLPIGARAPTLGYRARKYLARNRVGVAVGAAAIATLGTFGAFHTVRITRERDVAQLERDKAASVAGFLTEMLASADPRKARGETLTVYDVLARSEARLDTALADQPALREELLRVLGATYREMGDNARARRLLERAYAEAVALRGATDSAAIESAADLAATLRNLGVRDSAESIAEVVLASRQARYGGTHAKVAASLNLLGELRWAAGDFDSAAALIAASLALNRRLGADPEILAFNLNNLGAVMRSQRRNAEAEPVLREALALRQAALGPDHPAVATTALNLAAVLRDAGQYAVAESLFRASLEVRRRTLGPRHPEVASSLVGLGLTLMAAGDYGGARANLQDALVLTRETLGAEHPSIPRIDRALDSLRVLERRSDKGAPPRTARRPTP